MRLLRPRTRPEALDEPGPELVDALREDAARAESEGRLLDAIDLLRELDRIEADADVEVRLVDLRHRAFDTVAREPGRPSWPPTFDDLTPDDPGVPVVGPTDLTVDVLGSALVNHGALHVAGFLTPDRVQLLVDGIDRAFAGRDRWGDEDGPEDPPWFVPFVPAPPYHPGTLSRVWVRDGGGVWAADSPRVFHQLLELYDDLRLSDVIGGYLGERPAVSMRKCTLRRCPADLGHADWHQDGAFMGHDIRSVNVWIALTTCGGDSDAPGLEYVPHRVALQETGTKGAIFDWSVGPERVEEIVGETGAAVVRPRFEAGDALLFDDVFLHRTGVAPGLTVDRYAIESWFFAPSKYPSDQIPLVF